MTDGLPADNTVNLKHLKITKFLEKIKSSKNHPADLPEIEVK